MLKDFRRVKRWDRVTPSDIISSWQYYGYFDKGNYTLDDRSRTHRNLHLIPYDLRTEEVCKKAMILANGHVSGIPEKLVTRDMFEFLLENNFLGYNVAVSFSKFIQTEEEALALVESAYSCLEHIPEDMRTKKVCLAASKQSRYNYSHVPEDIFDFEIYNNFFSEGLELEHIPENYHTQEFFSLALEKEPDRLDKVPPQYWNVENLCHVMADFPTKIETVRKSRPELDCEEFYLAIETFHNYNLGRVPSVFRSKEVCIHFLKNDYGNIRYVPQEHLEDPDSLFELLKAAPNIFTSVKDYLSYDMCDWYLELTHSLRDIPTTSIDLRMCLKAVELNPSTLSYMPDHLKTPEVCLKAYESNPGAAVNRVHPEMRSYLNRHGDNPNRKSYEEHILDLKNEKQAEKETNIWNSYYGIKEVKYAGEESITLCMECITFDAVEKGRIPYEINRSLGYCLECKKENKS